MITLPPAPAHDELSAILDSLGRIWNPLLHPRDRYGRFIRTFSFVRYSPKKRSRNAPTFAGRVVGMDRDGDALVLVSAVDPGYGNNLVPGTIAKVPQTDLEVRTVKAKRVRRTLDDGRKIEVDKSLDVPSQKRVLAAQKALREMGETALADRLGAALRDGMSDADGSSERAIDEMRAVAEIVDGMKLRDVLRAGGEDAAADRLMDALASGDPDRLAEVMGSQEVRDALRTDSSTADFADFKGEFKKYDNIVSSLATARHFLGDNVMEFSDNRGRVEGNQAQKRLTAAKAALEQNAGAGRDVLDLHDGPDRGVWRSPASVQATQVRDERLDDRAQGVYDPLRPSVVRGAGQGVTELTGLDRREQVDVKDRFWEDADGETVVPGSVVTVGASAGQGGGSKRPRPAGTMLVTRLGTEKSGRKYASVRHFDEGYDKGYEDYRIFSPSKAEMQVVDADAEYDARFQELALQGVDVSGYIDQFTKTYVDAMRDHLSRHYSSPDAKTLGSMMRNIDLMPIENRVSPAADGEMLRMGDWVLGDNGEVGKVSWIHGAAGANKIRVKYPNGLYSDAITSKRFVKLHGEDSRDDALYIPTKEEAAAAARRFGAESVAAAIESDGDVTAAMASDPAFQSRLPEIRAAYAERNRELSAGRETSRELKRTLFDLDRLAAASKGLFRTGRSADEPFPSPPDEEGVTTPPGRPTNVDQSVNPDGTRTDDRTGDVVDAYVLLDDNITPPVPMETPRHKADQFYKTMYQHLLDKEFLAQRYPGSPANKGVDIAKGRQILRGMAEAINRGDAAAFLRQVDSFHAMTRSQGMTGERAATPIIRMANGRLTGPKSGQKVTWPQYFRELDDVFAGEGARTGRTTPPSGDDGVPPSASGAGDALSQALLAGRTVFRNGDGSPIEDGYGVMDASAVSRLPGIPTADDLQKFLTDNPLGEGDGIAIWRDGDGGGYSVARYRVFPAGEDGAAAANAHAAANGANQFVDIATGEVLNVSGTGEGDDPSPTDRSRDRAMSTDSDGRARVKGRTARQSQVVDFLLSRDDVPDDVRETLRKTGSGEPIGAEEAEALSAYVASIGDIEGGLGPSIKGVAQQFADRVAAAAGVTRARGYASRNTALRRSSDVTRWARAASGEDPAVREALAGSREAIKGGDYDAAAASFRAAADRLDILDPTGAESRRVSRRLREHADRLDATAVGRGAAETAPTTAPAPAPAPTAPEGAPPAPDVETALARWAQAGRSTKVFQGIRDAIVAEHGTDPDAYPKDVRRNFDAAEKILAKSDAARDDLRPVIQKAVDDGTLAEDRLPDDFRTPSAPEQEQQQEQQQEQEQQPQAPTAADLFKDDGWDDLGPEQQAAMERDLAEALAENPDLDLQEYRRAILEEEEEGGEGPSAADIDTAGLDVSGPGTEGEEDWVPGTPFEPGDPEMFRVLTPKMLNAEGFPFEYNRGGPDDAPAQLDRFLKEELGRNPRDYGPDDLAPAIREYADRLDAYPASIFADPSLRDDLTAQLREHADRVDLTVEAGRASGAIPPKGAPEQAPPEAGGAPAEKLMPETSDLPAAGGTAGLAELHRRFGSRDVPAAESVPGTQAAQGISDWVTTGRAPARFSTWLRDEATPEQVRDLFDRVRNDPDFGGTVGSAFDLLRKWDADGTLVPGQRQFSDASSYDYLMQQWEKADEAGRRRLVNDLDRFFGQGSFEERDARLDAWERMGDGLRRALIDHAATGKGPTVFMEDAVRWDPDVLEAYFALPKRDHDFDGGSRAEGLYVFDQKLREDPDLRARWEAMSREDRAAAVKRAVRTTKTEDGHDVADKLARAAAPEPPGSTGGTGLPSPSDAPRTRAGVLEAARQRLGAIADGTGAVGTLVDKQAHRNAAGEILKNTSLQAPGKYGNATMHRPMKDDGSGLGRHWSMTHTATGMRLPDPGDVLSNKERATRMTRWFDGFIAANPELGGDDPAVFKQWRDADGRTFAAVYSEAMAAVASGGPMPDEGRRPAPTAADLFKDDGWDDLGPDERAAVERTLAEALADDPDLDLEEFRRSMLEEEDEEPPPPAAGEGGPGPDELLAPPARGGGLKRFAQKRVEHYQKVDAAQERSSPAGTGPAPEPQPTPTSVEADDRTGPDELGAEEVRYPELEAAADAIGKLDVEDYEPTRQQKRIIAAFQTGKRVVVRALAGTGKTSTMLAIARRMPQGRKGLYLAFNKAVQLEAAGKFPDHVEARTANSMAWRAMEDRDKRFPQKTKTGISAPTEVYAAVGMSEIDGPDGPMRPVAVVGVVDDVLQRYMISADDELSMAHVDAVYEGSDEDRAKVLGWAQAMWKDYTDPAGELRYTQDALVKMWALTRPDFTEEGSGVRTPLKQGDTLFFDEAQDINDVLGRIVREQPNLQVITVGDGNQAIYCSILGTQVTVVRATGDYVLGSGGAVASGRWSGTPSGKELVQVPIEELVVGDRVLAYSTANRHLYRDGCTITSIERFRHDGDVVRVKMDNGSTTAFTPKHHVVARMGDALFDKYAVYLMRRGSQYRVGLSPVVYSGAKRQNGLRMRLNQERGDAVWLLSVHGTRAEALLNEQIVQHRFNIPGACFTSGGDVLSLDDFWSYVGDNRDAAERCLAAHGRLHEFPFATRTPLGDSSLDGGYGTRRAFVIAAANVVDGMEMLPQEADFAASGRALRDAWRTVSVFREPYADDVVSITVDKAHTYFADGILTHNSFRGASDQLDRMTADYDLPLTQSWRYGNGVGSFGNRALQLLDSPHRVVGAGPESTIHEPGTMNDPDAILARTNSGALAAALEMLARGRTVGVSARTRKNLEQLAATISWLRDGGEPPKAQDLHPDFDKYVYTGRGRGRRLKSAPDAWDAVQEAATDEQRPDKNLEKWLNIAKQFGDGEMDELLDQVKVTGGSDGGQVEKVRPEQLDPETLTEADPLHIGDDVYGWFEDGGRRFVIKGNGTFRNKSHINLRGATYAGARLRANWEDGKFKNWQVEFTRPPDPEALADSLNALQSRMLPEQVDTVISTAHLSKGLEWPKVRIWSDFRGPKSDKDNPNVPPVKPGDEEIRLAYVALTRAIRELDPGSLDWVRRYSDPEPGEDLQLPGSGDTANPWRGTPAVPGTAPAAAPAAPANLPTVAESRIGERAKYAYLTSRSALTRELRARGFTDATIKKYLDQRAPGATGQWNGLLRDMLVANDKGELSPDDEEGDQPPPGGGGGGEPPTGGAPGPSSKVRLTGSDMSAVPVADRRPPLTPDEESYVAPARAERDAEFADGVSMITPNAAAVLGGMFSGIGGGIVRTESRVDENGIPRPQSEGRNNPAGSDTRTAGQATASFAANDHVITVSDRALKQQHSRYGHVVPHESAHALDAQLGALTGAGTEGRARFFSANDEMFQRTREDIESAGLVRNADGDQVQLVDWYFLDGDRPSTNGKHNGTSGSTELFAQGYAAYAGARASGVDMKRGGKQERLQVYKSMGEAVVDRRRNGNSIPLRAYNEATVRIGMALYTYFDDLESKRIPEIQQRGETDVVYPSTGSPVIGNGGQLLAPPVDGDVPAVNDVGEISPGLGASAASNPLGGPDAPRNGTDMRKLPRGTRSRLVKELRDFSRATGSNVRSLRDLRDNVLASIGAASSRELEYGRQWYAQARTFAENLGKTGAPGRPRASEHMWQLNAALVAATSPKTRWEANRAAADLVQRSIDPELSPVIDDAYVGQVLRPGGPTVRSMLYTDAALTKAVRKKLGLAKGAPTPEGAVERFVDEQLAARTADGSAPQLYRFADDDFRSALINVHNRVVGRQEQLAAGIPEGELDGMGMRYRLLTTDGEEITAGPPHRLANVMSTQMSAVNGIYNYRDVQTDGVLVPEDFDPVPRTAEKTYDNISRALGGHKTRSFYNNIVTGGDSRLSVTVDTHMLDAMILGVLASRSGVFANGKEGFLSGGGDNSAEGRKGRYPLFQEGIRQAVESLGEGWTMAQAQAVSWVTTLAGSESSWIVNEGLRVHDPEAILRAVAPDASAADAETAVDALRASGGYRQANSILADAGADFRFTRESHTAMKSLLRDPWDQFNAAAGAGTTLKLAATRYAAAAHIVGTVKSDRAAKKALESVFADPKLAEKQEKARARILEIDSWLQQDPDTPADERARLSAEREKLTAVVAKEHPRISIADVKRLRDITQRMMTLDRLMEARNEKHRRRILDRYNERRRSLGVSAGFELAYIDEILGGQLADEPAPEAPDDAAPAAPAAAVQ